LLSNIVCFFFFAEEARALRLMKPANTSPERLDGLSLDRRHCFQQQEIMLFSYGGEPDTANENLRNLTLARRAEARRTGEGWWS
jgi:hypothetical protein